jgi:hypothetical protein
MRPSFGLLVSVVITVTTLACADSKPLTVDGGASVGGASGSAGTTGGTGSAGTTSGTGSAGTVGGTGGAPDAGVCGDPYANSSMPLAPCAVDSDCHSAYLFCGPPLGTVEGCRDADAAADNCVAPALSDLPICPTTVRITANLCGIRYQRPCNIDSDCGPGFTCDLSGASTCPVGSPCGTCQAPPQAACVTKSDCPKEWDCYASCGCSPTAPTFCFPPFEIFRCPECPPTPGP